MKVNIKMVRMMGKVYCKIIIMGKNMRENGKSIIEKDLVFNIIKMVRNMKDIGKMMNMKEEEYMINKMAQNMMESG